MIGWILLGLGVGLLNALLAVRTVAKLRPEMPYSVWMVVLRGWGARFGLAAAVLLVAVQQSVRAAIFVFLGLWLARWVLVRRAVSERIAWAWFET